MSNAVLQQIFSAYSINNCYLDIKQMEMALKYTLPEFRETDTCLKTIKSLDCDSTFDALQFLLVVNICRCQKFIHYRSSVALAVIDFQWDFIRGSLRVDKCPAGEDPLKNIGKINQLFQFPFGAVYVSQDWHPPDHISFIENFYKWKTPEAKKTPMLYEEVELKDSFGKRVKQIMWPAHCVANTKGAQLHPDLKLPSNAVYIRKGMISDVESYSAFGGGREDSGFNEKLKNSNIKVLVMCGIATDVCVAATALEAVSLGYTVIVVEDASAGIEPVRIRNKRLEMIKAGIMLMDTEEVLELFRAPLSVNTLIKLLKRHSKCAN